MGKKAFSIRNADLQYVEALVSLLEQLFPIEKDFEFNSENHCCGLRLILDGCLRHRAVKVRELDRLFCRQWISGRKKEGSSIFNSLQTRTMPLPYPFISIKNGDRQT